MNLHTRNRHRVLLALSLLWLFAVPDSAHGGLLARLRARRCRAAVCQPSCCQPTSAAPAAALRTAAFNCTGKVCQRLVVTEVYAPVDPEHPEQPPKCLYAIYRGQDCDTGYGVQVPDACKLPVSLYCNNSAHCADCISKVGAILIHAEPLPPKTSSNGSADQDAWYVPLGLQRQGLPVKPQLRPGELYKMEVRPVNGAEKPGIAFNMKLLDERQQPTGEERLVHIDWFMPKKPNGEMPLKNVGIGYQTVEEQPDKVEYKQVRYTECVYAVFLKQGDIWRFYVVFLPKAEAPK